MLLTSAFLKENSAISLEEWVLVFKLFTTDTRNLRVKCESRDDLHNVCLLVGWLLNVPATCECISGMDLLRQFYVLPH